MNRATPGMAARRLARSSEGLGRSRGRFGHLYIAEYTSNRVRKVNAAGVITTVAGTGERYYGGDGARRLARSSDCPGT